MLDNPSIVLATNFERSICAVRVHDENLIRPLDGLETIPNDRFIVKGGEKHGEFRHFFHQSRFIHAPPSQSAIQTMDVTGWIYPIALAICKG